MLRVRSSFMLSFIAWPVRGNGLDLDGARKLIRNTGTYIPVYPASETQDWKSQKKLWNLFSEYNRIPTFSCGRLHFFSATDFQNPLHSPLLHS